MTREDILRALRDEFRQNTRERLTEMRSLLERLRTSPDNGTLRDVERHFHGLAGLGGTYGYATISSLSREGESICGSTSFRELDFDRLSGILSAIAEAIEDVPDNE